MVEKTFENILERKNPRNSKDKRLFSSHFSSETPVFFVPAKILVGQKPVFFKSLFVLAKKTLPLGTLLNSWLKYSINTEWN